VFSFRQVLQYFLGLPQVIIAELVFSFRQVLLYFLDLPHVTIGKLVFSLDRFYCIF
jgi:hypothetical protein